MLLWMCLPQLIKTLRHTVVREFRPWLKTVTKNHLHHQYKRISRMRVLEIDDSMNESEANFMEFSDDGSPTNEWLQKEIMSEKLLLAIDQLNQEQSECIKLFYLEKLSYADTCSRTGYSFKQVKSFNPKRKEKSQKFH